jgi:hypothetical protein
MVAFVVVLLFSVPRGIFTLADKQTRAVSYRLGELADWQFHTHFLQSYPGLSATHGDGCTAVNSDHRHIAWVFRTRALIVVLGSLVSRVEVRRSCGHGAHPARI